MKFDLNSILILMIISGLSLGTPLSLKAQENEANSSYVGKTMVDLPYCKKEYRNAPPLWVTTTGYDAEKDQNAKINKNYAIGEKNYTQEERNKKMSAAQAKIREKNNPFIVPKRSIVQLHPQSQAMYEQLGSNPEKKLSPDAVLGVRILSIPPSSEKLNENAIPNVKNIARFRDHLRNTNIKPQFAKPGDKGYLKFGDLERVKEQKGYVFILKKDSELYKFINQDTGEEAIALELAQENGRYIVNHCCGTDGVCRDFAIYKALNPKTGEEIKTKVSLEADCESCLANQSIPMKKDFMAPLQSLVDVLNQERKTTLSQFNFVDSRGFVQLPVSDQDKTTGYKQGPFGAAQYTPEAGNADIYLKPDVACGFSQLLKTWQSKHCSNNAANCRIEFGNASHAFYEKSTGNSRWPHNSHSNGECIDIRPSYKVPAQGGRSFSSSQFDKEKFRNLMKLAEQLGPDTCFTTRNDINREFRNTANCAYDKDHDDHLHICFPRKNGTKLNEKLMNACLNGVK